MVVFEDAQEREEREKRICNLVVEGLPVENKTQEDALAVVNEFLFTELETEVHPTAVVRLRNPSHGNGKLNLLIKFKDVSDKVLVLRNCKKTESLSGNQSFGRHYSKTASKSEGADVKASVASARREDSFF